MTMRCPNCGNQINPGETFCGQCGTPNIPPAQPTEAMNSQSVRSGLISGGYNPTSPSTSNAYNAGMNPSSNPAHTFYGGQSAPSSSLYPSQPAIEPNWQRQQTGFYRDATEAISSLPPNSNQNYPAAYSQQAPGFPGSATPGGYAGANQYPPAMMPFQAGNYSSPPTMYSPPQPFTNGQNYQRKPDFPPPEKKQNNIILIIACICLSVAIVAVAALGAIYLLHNNSSKAHNKTASTPTSIVTPTTAPSPSPTLSPTAATTPSPTSSPSPSASPTFSVDPGFTQCATECAANGFIVEYPTGWMESPSQDPNGFGGEQFAASSSNNNPPLQDEIANFKSATTTGHTPQDLIAADLNTQFANLQGYTAPTASSDAWIDGAQWLNEAASYQLNNQTEDVQLFAIVYQQRSYIIELQAPHNSFDQVNTQYFEFMLGRFQFQQTTP